MEETALFYGPHEILSKVEADGFVTITLKREEGDSKFELKLPTALFELLVTTEKKDYNYLQEIKLNTIIKEVIESLTKFNVTGGEFKPFINLLTLSYFNVIDRAINYQFTGNDESFVPGGDLYYDFSLQRAHEITKDLDVAK